MKAYGFTATIEKVEGIDGTFVQVPLDLPKVFGAGRIKVHAAIGKGPGDSVDVSLVCAQIDGPAKALR